MFACSSRSNFLLLFTPFSMHSRLRCFTFHSDLRDGLQQGMTRVMRPGPWTGFVDEHIREVYLLQSLYSFFCILSYNLNTLPILLFSRHLRLLSFKQSLFELLKHTYFPTPQPHSHISHEDLPQRPRFRFRGCYRCLTPRHPG